MRRSQLAALAAVCGAMFLAGPAVAASDYLLEIDGVKGESGATSPAKSIEVSSFSWGMNQTSATSREAASGMATGKRQPLPANAAAVARPVAAAGSPATDSVMSFILAVAEPGNETAAFLVRVCANGEHIPHAVLTTPSGRFELKDAIITSCPVSGNMRRHEFTGHITLMK